MHNVCAKGSKKIHGNSLKSKKENFLYTLKDTKTDKIQKNGESIRPKRRYTQKFLNNNLQMTIIGKGSKQFIHTRQNLALKAYYKINGKLPALNKTFW